MAPVVGAGRWLYRAERRDAEPREPVGGAPAVQKAFDSPSVASGRAVGTGA